jgi:hypothetical protein
MVGVVIMTVGELRKFLADLPDDMQVRTYEYEGQPYLSDETYARLTMIGPLFPNEQYTATVEVEVNGSECVLVS